MGDFRVTELLGSRPWSSSEYGDFIAYAFRAEGQERPLEWSRKVGTPGPSVGETLTGEVEDKGPNYPLKFKKAKAGGFGGGGRSPQESKSIVRQHSQEMALRYAAIQASRGKLPDDFAYTKLEPIIDWFVKDAGS